MHILRLEKQLKKKKNLNFEYIIVSCKVEETVKKNYKLNFEYIIVSWASSCKFWTIGKFITSNRDYHMHMIFVLVEVWNTFAKNIEEIMITCTRFIQFQVLAWHNCNTICLVINEHRCNGLGLPNDFEMHFLSLND